MGVEQDGTDVTIEERVYTPDKGEGIPDLFAQLSGVLDPHTMQRLISGYEALHSRNANEWDRRVLTMRYDRYIAEMLELLLQNNGSLTGAVDET